MTVTVIHSNGEIEAGSHPQTVAFIYGIGSTGLTPFEYALAHQAVNGCLEMQVRKSEIRKVFAHLSPSIRQHPIWSHCDTVDFSFRIGSIEPAASAYIIMAMADAAGCGDGCGDGCCGHESFPIIKD